MHMSRNMSFNLSCNCTAGILPQQSNHEMWDQLRYLPFSEDNSSMLNGGTGGGGPYGIPPIVKWILLTVYVIMMVIALGGNAVVCYTVLSKQRLRTVTNFFIVSLSVSDIIMTILCVPFTLLSNMIFYYWPFGPLLCPLVGYFQLMSVILRAFTLVAITCDRHYVIWRPLKQRLKKMHAKGVICVLWIAAALIALPTALHSKIIYLPYEPGSKGLCIESWTDHDARYAYSLSIMLLQYFAPLLLMLVTYIHIGVIIWIKRPPGEADQNRDKRLQRSKKKTVKMLVAVVTAYALSWLPLHAITLAGDVNPGIYNDMNIHIVWLFAHWLAFSNCAINPIIYCWMNSTFRNAFKVLFQKVECYAISKLRRKNIAVQRMPRVVSRKSSSMNRSQYSGEHSDEKLIQMQHYNYNLTSSTYHVQ